MRDYTLGDTFDIKFTTRAFATGAPTTLAGTPVISAYPDNSVTQLTAGITLTVDFDGVTGLHNIRVVATGGNGYATGSTYALVITTGTVGGTSVVGEVVGEFTLGRSAAAVDLANATDGLSALKTLIDTLDDFVDTEVAAIKTKTDFLPSATAGAAGGLFIAGANAATSIATALTADITGNLSGSVGSVTGAVGSVTGLTAATVHSDLDDIQARLPAALTGVGNLKADVLAINGNATSAAVLAILNGATVVYQGTVTGAASVTTLIDSGLTQSDTDWWKGRIIIFTSVITLQATDITAFDPALDKLTFTAVTAVPTGATYVII